MQPASLDLRLGREAYRVRASFLPGKAALADRLADFEMHRIDLAGGAVLEKGCVYVVPLVEGLALPADVSAVANAKSSTGRLDLFTRLITDRGTEFDRIEAGYAGPLYAEISPRSFSVLVRPGMRLNQIRFRRGSARAQRRRPARARRPRAAGGRRGAYRRRPRLLGRPGAAGGSVGWRAKPHAGLIDLDRVGHYDPADYWEPVAAHDRRIILDPGAFYILVSREAVHVPPDYAAEMAPYLAMVGEFRVHYAGFFDPGFGHAGAGGGGSRGRAGGALPRGALRARPRPGGRAAGLRAHGRAARHPLRPRRRLELPGPGPEALEALPRRLRRSGRTDRSASDSNRFA